MVDEVRTSDNPYVGPRAFTTDEKNRFFGRDRAARELLNLLLTERVVLLHSSSGAGKSSLVHASLIPALEAEGFHVFPIIRVNAEVAGGRFDRKPNRYVQSAMHHLERGRKTSGLKGMFPNMALRELTSLTLSEYLQQNAPPPEAAEGSGNSRPRPEMLIFDQFEEILTVDPTAYDAKSEFFKQVGDALRVRHRWALFVMREEHVAALDPYLFVLPSSVSTRYCLALLDETNAREAIEKPAALGLAAVTSAASGAEGAPPAPPPRKVTYEKGALDLLVKNLRTVQRAGESEPTLDRWIEPVYLQVVCSTLWDKLPPDATKITVADVERIGDVDRALATYYAERVQEAAAAAKVPEARIRAWIESRLIERDIRTQVLKGSESVHGVNAAAVDYLDMKFILRQDNRRNGVWYELAHDRLIHPVKRDNARWFFERGSGHLHKQAEFWINNGKPDHALLRDQALTDARKFLAAQPDSVTPALAEFVRASRDKARLRQLVGGVVMLAVAAGLWLAVLTERGKDRDQQMVTASKTREKNAELERWRDSVLRVLPVLREKSWGLPVAQQSGFTLQRSLRADSLIRDTAWGNSGAAPADTVIYYLKPTDPRGAQTALHDLGFPLDVQNARSDAIATNAIAYAGNTRVENVRVVALTLIRSGVTIRAICPPVRGTHDSHAIQIFSTIRAQDKPPIDIDRILQLSDGARRINCAL